MAAYYYSSYEGISNSTTTANSTWYAYNTFTTAGTATITYPEAYETEEQKQARLERQKQYDLEQERILKEQEQAKEKADELLKSHIGVEAFGRLHQVGNIEVDSQKYQGRKYRIGKNARSLIEILENGKVVDRLCVHPDQRYQDSDEILTRLTLLEYAEEYLLKIANHHLVRV